MNKITSYFASSRLKNELATKRPKLYRIAYSWCHSASLADDLVQETLYKAIAKSDSLRDESIIDTWLYRIMFNCWQDVLRVKGRNTEFVETTDEASLDNIDAYQQGQIVKRVRSAIASLPMNLREVVTLADFGGMTYAQIAEIVDIPIGTVMSRLFRARKELQRMLMDLNNEENNHMRLRRVK